MAINGVFRFGMAFSMLAGAAFGGAAFAQATDPGLIDRPQVRAGVPEKFQLNQQPVKAIQEEPKQEAVENPDKVVATINDVVFSGATKVEEPLLQVIASPYVGRPITNRDLAELKYKIAQEYYRRGYTLVKAVTPQQSLDNGVLEVRIVEATVGNVNIQRNDALHPYIAQGMLGAVKPGSVFNEREAESLVSDINDLKNIHSSLNLKPGAEFATTDIDVFIEPASEDENYVTFDNYGSELTGEYVGQLHLEKSNLLTLGERVYGDFRMSHEDLYSLGGGVDVPTGLGNTIFHTSYYWTQNDIGGPLEPFGIEGESETFDVSVSSALLNTRDEKIEVRGGVEARRHESSLSDVTQWEDNVRQAYVEGSYLKRAEATVWYAAVRVSRGINTFGASEQHGVLQPSSAARSRLLGEHDAFIVQPTLLVNYQPSVPFFEDGTFRAFTTGQMASNALYSSDLFVLGGYGSVRGFEPAYTTGEAGYQFTLEYQHDIPVNPDWIVLFGPWFDGGMVYNRVPSPTNGIVDRHLYSTGLGLEANGEVLPVGETTVRLDWAYPLGHYDQADVDDNTFYFRVSQFF